MFETKLNSKYLIEEIGFINKDMLLFTPSFLKYATANTWHKNQYYYPATAYTYYAFQR